MRLNEKKVFTPWSLRDISKLFARIKKQSKEPEDHYKNMGLYEHILFYVLSSTNDSLVEERREEIVNLIINILNHKYLLNEN